jgi:Holliday junction resolvasome RuvABC DNA-binding subunit
MTLGYSRSEAAEAINLIQLEAPSTEALMKEALRSLMRR